MRRLAQELDTGAASLYVYVRNTAELHAAMLEELLGQVDLTPVTAAGDWRERLIKVLWSYTRILFDQPGLAQSVLVTRPSGPAYLSLAEGILTLLSAPARCPRTGPRGQWTSCCTSPPRPPSSRPPASGRSRRATKKTPSSVALREAPAATFPHIAALGSSSCPGQATDRLTWGFQVLINGILQTPRPEPGAAR